MNFFKGIVSRRHDIKDEEDSEIQKEKSLCIQHLRKVFLEFLHPPAPLTIEQSELKQYFMLPLFLKSFYGSDASQLSERFGDVLQFAGHTSKLMVLEIQRKAANKSKREASKDIMLYLFRNEDEMENKGWNLIQTLNILTEGEIAIVQCMIAASLHSILVKCINIFFSLPKDFENYEKCLEVQRVFIPILTKLCNHPITAKALIQTDDLASLFDALTCSCKQEHVMWRTGVSEVLMAITRHCLTKDIIEYIYGMLVFFAPNLSSFSNASSNSVVCLFATFYKREAVKCVRCFK